MIRKLFAKSPGAGVLTGAYLAVCGCAIAAVVKSVGMELVSGDLCQGLFGTGEGLVYGLFKTQLYVGLLAVVLMVASSALFAGLFAHANMKGWDFGAARQEKPKFFKRPGFWCVAVYNMMFVLSGLVCLGGMGDAAGTLLSGAGEAGSLLTVMSMPLMLAAAAMFGIVAIMGIAATFVAYFKLPGMFNSCVSYLQDIITLDRAAFAQNCLD